MTLGNILNFLHEKDIDFKFVGNREQTVCMVSSITNYKKNTLTWIKSKDKYLELAKNIDFKQVDAIIVDNEIQKIANLNNAIICENPKFTFSVIISGMFKQNDLLRKIGDNTIIEKSAKIGTNVFIGCNCYIGNNVQIGDGTHIYHNVVINENVIIGRNCCLKSGVVIGQEGYGYSTNNDSGYFRFPHLGSVVIEDNVDIGSNTCIDRGTIDDTIIKSGCKIDNLCHIAHNVQIGRNAMLVAGTVIGGSVIIADDAYLAPGAIVRNQLTIGQNSLVGMGSVVTKNTDKEYVYAGVPAKAIRKRSIDEKL